MAKRKLIIHCSATGSVVHQERGGEYAAIPTSPESIAESCREAYEAGAAVVHVHGPVQRSATGGSPTLDVEGSRRMHRLIRERCGDVILQFGLAGVSLAQRRQLLENPDGRPDMMSVCLTEHDYNFDGVELNVMHPRPELEEYAAVCRDNGVKPEFEMFHLGALFNLEWLERKGLIEKPYFITLFFSPKGGVWTPPNVDELMHRIRYLPPDVIFQACVWAGSRGTATPQDQINVLTACMLNGGHVRVGLEDHERYWWNDEPATSNAAMVGAIARMAGEAGLEVATPAEAREMMGMRALR